ncbi:MAG: SLC13 family permease [Actinomycetota bacterium]
MDLTQWVLWGAAVVLGGVATVYRPWGLWAAARVTATPFLTLGAIISAAAFADHLGLFKAMARLLIPSKSSALAAVAAVLGFTALLSGLVNLDVAVVVAMPLSLRVASRTGLSAGLLAAGIAVTANATSFLLPTSNVTTLLILTRASGRTVDYLAGSWIAWIFVTVLTVAALSLVLVTSRGRRAPVAVQGGVKLRAIIDLVPLFFAASAIRTLLAPGVWLHGSFIEQLSWGSVFGATVNNLPAAAAIHASGATNVWAAILALSIGPNMLFTGSVATLICRRIARDSGAKLSALPFSALGIGLLPAQVAVAYVGLHLTDALR